MNNQSDSLSCLVTLLFLCLVLAVAVQVAVDNRPEYTMIDASQAFVYPAGDATLIALPQGPYKLSGPLTSGCYRLDKPAAGADYGKATWSSEVCK